MTKICYITAIYGDYEKSCKKYVKQTIESDFICFTDNAEIIKNNWEIDTNPYHITHKNTIDNDEYVNSLCNNTHTFNIAKYYKQSFHLIPRLQIYDIIIWLDATIEIIYDKTSEYILSKIFDNKIITWHHEWRFGMLYNEVQAAASHDKYCNTTWNGQKQPYQDVKKQYMEYINDGYDEYLFKRSNHHSPHYGVWITCFIAFLQKDEKIRSFLNHWYLQTLKYTTEDQVSFSYSCQKQGLYPLTLPYEEIKGEPHQWTTFYIKQDHGI